MNFYRKPDRFVLLLLVCLVILEVTSSQEGSSYFFYQQPEYPRDCKDVRDQCPTDSFSGVYIIKPDGYPQPFEVYCENDFLSGGWTVIQRRIDGSLAVKRNWEEYKSGFGFLSSEFWIGNDRLSYLTNQAIYELRIDMTLANGSSFYVEYNSFRISDEWSQYTLVNADEFSSNSSCIVSTCPSNTNHGGCTCQNLCNIPIGTTDCDDDCTEICVPNGCFVSDTNSNILNGETYVNNDCSQKCSCNSNQLNCNNYECSPDAECRLQDDVRQCYCKNGYSGDGENCTPDLMTYTDCYDAYQAGQTQDGVYSILPSGWTESPFNAPCNMTIDGGGWTVLQRRVDGSENFDRNWTEYKNGFGVPGPELWLGNDKMYYLTNQRDYELRMDMVNLDGDAYFAKYNIFRITDESSNYQLVSLGVYNATSTTGYDSMAHHRNQFFSTPENDNDPYSDFDCAAHSYYRSGWWYGDDIDNFYCDYCNFNSPGFGVNNNNCPYWYNLPGNDCLMYTDIKIRPV